MFGFFKRRPRHTSLDIPLRTAEKPLDDASPLDWIHALASVLGVENPGFNQDVDGAKAAASERIVELIAESRSDRP